MNFNKITKILLIFSVWVCYIVPTHAGIYTVNNTNNSGGGSLRQAIIDANGAGGPHTIRFNIPLADPNYNAGTGVYSINLTSSLPSITRDGITIDGTTQTLFTGNTNSAILGTGGTVGLDSVSLSQLNAPEVQIVDAAGLDYALWVRANDFTFRGLAIYGFGTDAYDYYNSPIIVGDWLSSWGVKLNNLLFEQCLFGSPADSLYDPAPANPNTAKGISVLYCSNVTFRNNIFIYFESSGISVIDDSDNILIDDNELTRNGKDLDWFDGIDLSNGTNFANVTHNLVTFNGACGIDIWGNVGNDTIRNNSILNNGISAIAAENAGIRLTGSDNVILKNIIENNAGAGVMVLRQTGAIPNTPGTQTLISQNRFINNLSNAIDLQNSGADLGLGDTVSLNNGTFLGDGSVGNSCGTQATSANIGIDYPLIDTVYQGLGMDTIFGRACPNGSVEIYLVNQDTGDYKNGNYFGEGLEYIGTTTADGSGNFSFTYPNFLYGRILSAIVIDAGNNTSEFGKNYFVSFPENCTNGLDDDGDGNIDCADSDCVPGTPGSITASNDTVCDGVSGEPYSITPVAGATSYDWTVPAGATITAGQGTVSISVDWGTSSGNICARSYNGFCYSPFSCTPILVKTPPVDPAAIIH